MIDSLTEVQGALLTYTELHCEAVPADLHNPVAQLWVHLDAEYILRIFCANDALSEAPADASSVYYFVSRFSCHLPPELHAELQRLLGVFNYLLPMGMLELHPEEGIFFRHMLLTEEPVLDGLLGLDIVLALKSLLPMVFGWLQQVIEQAPLNQSIQPQIRQSFRDLLQYLPAQEPFNPHLQTPPPARQTSLNGFQNSSVLALSGSLLSTGLVAWATTNLSLGLLAGSLTILGGVGLGRYLNQNRQHKQAEQKKQKELQFFWQLLEVETIKLAYQDHALEQHRQHVIQKLAALATHPIVYPADVVRLRAQMRFLRELQSHLVERVHQLKLKRQELEDNRFQLVKERLSLQRLPELDSLALMQTGFASEDMLMQNLVVTLDYLEFPVQVLSPLSSKSPLILVYMRSHLPPLVMGWTRHWHQAPDSPQHSWMLSFELTLPGPVPLELWPQVQEILQVFNRFLPLGSLMSDRERQQISLRYRFVRLRGDLSAMLVLEILEVLASFGERLQQRLDECLQTRKDLAHILQETEAEFQALQL